MKKVIVFFVGVISILYMSPTVDATAGTTQETTTQTVEAGIVPELVLTPPAPAAFTDFVVGTNIREIGSFNIKSNRVFTPYIKANSTKMAPWDNGTNSWASGSALTDGFQYKPQGLSAFLYISTIDSTGQPVPVSPATGTDISMQMKQIVGYNDESLVGSKTYRIIITYTAIQTP